MKNSKRTILIISMLFMIGIWVFIALNRGETLFHGLDLFIFILIVVLGFVALYRAYRKNKELQDGLPADDELSNKIKYESGYYAYLYSMYMWLFIFLLRDKFPNVESMVGGGILLSAFIAFISKIVVTKKT